MKAAVSSSGGSASRGLGASSAVSTARPASRRRSSVSGTSGTSGASGTSGTSGTPGTSGTVGTVGNAGNVGFSSRRKSLAHEAGGHNRLELSPVYEGGLNGGPFATSPMSSPAAQGRVSAGMGGASAGQVLLPPRTPHAAAARGADSAAAAASSAAGATAAVAAPVAGGAGVVHTTVGGIAMETPRCGTAGPRARGGVRGHGHGEGDESWSEDDATQSGAGRGMGDRIGQPHGSWGGCSTIKRRADEMVDHTHGVFTGHGGRGIGVAHRGSADDDGNILGRGFPNRSRMSSSSTSSSLSLGGEALARSTGGTGDEAEGGLGTRQTPHDGWRRGGDGGVSGGASSGAGSARERYGRGGSVGSASGGGGGGGRGRVDYHSLCFSSSSSGYSASSSSPFGLLDRDSSNSEN